MVLNKYKTDFFSNSLAVIRIIKFIGLKNIFFNLSYRIKKRNFLSRLRRISSNLSNGILFDKESIKCLNQKISLNQTWEKNHFYFGSTKDISINELPSWHSSFRSDALYCEPELPWYKIPLHQKGHDIKETWEASRMGWLITFSQKVSLGNLDYLNYINNWTNDWISNNPPYLGPNWVCAQETAIRLLNIFICILILRYDSKPNQYLVNFIVTHLKRIEPSTFYSISQQNNHASSEAAALFIGGSYLISHGYEEGKKWEKKGRRMLEDCSKTLIGDDGSFSQFSTNYHRLMLDTFSLCEIWRRKLMLEKFSNDLYLKLQAASDWLFYLTDEENGHIPNLGANDGSYLLNICGKDYGDFRPSVKLAIALFQEKDAYPDKKDLYAILIWLGVKEDGKEKKYKESRNFNNTGLFALKGKNYLVSLKYPNNNFRPAQNDALHIDFIHNGENILRDAGSYAYNLSAEEDFFSSVKGHNTIEFDDLEQMEKLGRFMYKDWLNTLEVKGPCSKNDSIRFSASYEDSRKNFHKRTINFNSMKNFLEIKDLIHGNFLKAKLRLRLANREWYLKDNVVSDDKYQIKFECNSDINIQICSGYESINYLHKETLDVIEVSLDKPSLITTSINWS